jgi:hypothetical protein
MLRHLLKDDFLSEDERYHGICLFAPKWMCNRVHSDYIYKSSFIQSRLHDTTLKAKTMTELD